MPKWEAKISLYSEIILKKEAPTMDPSIKSETWQSTPVYSVTAYFNALHPIWDC